MKTQKSEAVVWVERFGLVDIATLICKYLFSEKVIRYDENNTSQTVRIVLRFFNKLGMFRDILPAELELGADANGCSLVYSVQKELDGCTESFCSKYMQENTKAYKQMIKCYMASWLTARVKFINMVKLRTTQFGPGNNRLYLARHPLNTYLVELCRKQGFSITESFFSLDVLRFFLRPYFLLLLILLDKIFPKKHKSNIKETKPSIWVEYCNDTFTDLTFWKPYVRSNNMNTVYYLDRADTPLTAELAEKIEKRGLRWIELHTKALCSDNVMMHDINTLLEKLVFKRVNVPFWTRNFQLEADILFLLYSSLFKRYQVKLLIQHQEFSWTQEVQKQAIESAGGIMIGFQWSNQIYYPEPQYLMPQHVYFVWGKVTSEWLEKKGNSCAYILPSGIWIMPDKKDEQPLINFTSEVKFIIAILDTSTGYNTYCTPSNLLQFYTRVIRLIEDNPSFGGIVKSKNWNVDGLTILPGGDDIVQRLKALCVAQRIVFLKPTVSPVTAAQHAHLSVCNSINSAGIISAIHGHRVIHWDCSCLLINPLYRDPDQKFIFKFLDAMERAILEVADGDSEIGDFLKYRQFFNYFDDLNAPARVGQFIQTFMDEIIKTGDRKQSLAVAVQKYIRDNNIGDDFFAPGQWWEFTSGTPLQV